MTELAWAGLSSPVGPLAVGCSPAGVARLDFRSPGGAGGARAAQGSPALAGTRTASTPQASAGLLSAARDQLAEYFAGQRQVFDLPVDWSGCSRAQHQVLSVLYDSVGYGRDGHVRGTGAARGGRAGRDLAPGAGHRADHGLEPDPADRAVPPGGRRQRAGRLQRRHRHRDQAVAADLRGGPAGHPGLEPGRAPDPAGRPRQAGLSCPSGDAPPGTPACSSRRAAPRTRPAAAARVSGAFAPSTAQASSRITREVLPVPADHGGQAARPGPRPPGGAPRRGAGQPHGERPVGLHALPGQVGVGLDGFGAPLRRRAEHPGGPVAAEQRGQFLLLLAAQRHRAAVSGRRRARRPATRPCCPQTHAEPGSKVSYRAGPAANSSSTPASCG